MFYAVNDILTSFLRSAIYFLPNFIGGVLIFSIGIILSQIARRALFSMLEFIKIDAFIKTSKLGNGKTVGVWKEIMVEILGWSVIILFLIPAAEVWGLSRVTEVLNQLLFYLPNVVVAVIIGFIGIIFANLVSDLVRHGVRTVGSKSANSLAALAQYSILFFTVLIVMNQLGIAQDLIRILFTGIVAMIAIAGGLAFGMGGKELAREILEELKKNISS